VDLRLLPGTHPQRVAEGRRDRGFEVYRPAGTYFVTTDIRPLGATDGFAFCRSLPERAGVVAIPNAVFYDHRDQGAPFVRFAFCKRTEVLEEAVTRLKRLA
jgi:N-succinyldiaminopimelate aminotransferase